MLALIFCIVILSQLVCVSCPPFSGVGCRLVVVVGHSVWFFPLLFTGCSVRAPGHLVFQFAVIVTCCELTSGWFVALLRHVGK